MCKRTLYQTFKKIMVFFKKVVFLLMGNGPVTLGSKISITVSKQIVHLRKIRQLSYKYSRRKYYCYHQNAILLPFKKGNFSNIAIAILDFLDCYPFSYRSSNFAIAKVFALNLSASIFVVVLQIGLWLLFCIASHIVIDLPTIATERAGKIDNFRKEAIKKEAKTDTKRMQRGL